MKMITDILTPDIRSVAIAGHVNPDGDCVGSCAALALYLKKNRPEIRTVVYLEKVRPALRFLLPGIPSIVETGPNASAPCDPLPDLFILLDVSTPDRIGAAREIFDRSSRTVCIDHHLSNGGIASVNVIQPEIGSCAEVLYGLLEKDRIDAAVAKALYTGIIHDTGVLQYSNTRPETLRIAADLMTYGFDFSQLIFDSFNARSYKASRFLGCCLSKRVLADNGRIVFSGVTAEEMAAYGVTRDEAGEIIPQLRMTEGTLAAVFAYESAPGVFKVSLRSSRDATVNKTAEYFGGGGHAKAAGCTITGRLEEVLSAVVEKLKDEIA